MASFEQLPGTLSVACVAGDELSVPVDFSISLAGYTVAASVVSLVDAREVVQPIVSVTNETAGIVAVSLTETATASITPGSYRWRLTWTSDADAERTALAGIFEVKAR